MTLLSPENRQRLKNSAKSQILWMFLLPLGIAFIHSLAAFPILQKMVTLFGSPLSGATSSLILALGIVTLFIACFYGIIWRITTGIYYRIVR